ncbi:unnamed protein product [Strongylus vulgaris]|uniref:Uncharacterized protein n=1 Tax=Strongylus vulgaris TaxID=40348 RepID=A0A3P7ISR3_STRVU|nr:unnamed protein product [Strongylus vulgaris]
MKTNVTLKGIEQGYIQLRVVAKTAVFTLQMLYVVLWAALPSGILALISDLNCTRVDIMPGAAVKIVYTEKAVICGNKLPDDYCEKIMNAAAMKVMAGVDTDRPDHCFKVNPYFVAFLQYTK